MLGLRGGGKGGAVNTLDDAGDLRPVPEPELHIYRRVRVLANGTTIWACRVCGGRRLYPPLALATRHIQLRPETGPHVILRRDSWPGWPALEPRPLFWYDLS